MPRISSEIRRSISAVDPVSRGLNEVADRLAAVAPGGLGNSQQASLSRTVGARPCAALATGALHAAVPWPDVTPRAKRSHPAFSGPLALGSFARTPYAPMGFARVESVYGSMLRHRASARRAAGARSGCELDTTAASAAPA